MENESLQSTVNRQETAAPTQGDQVLAGLDEFARIFPDAYTQAKNDINSLPEQVWKGVRDGLSLAASYAKYGGDRGRNASRSTGSMRSAGQEFKSSDPFLEGWGD